MADPMIPVRTEPTSRPPTDSSLRKTPRAPRGGSRGGSGDKVDLQIQDLLSQRKFSQAESMIQKRLKEDPDNPDIHYLHGVLYYFQGQVGLTVENLKKALALDPKHTDAAICLSVLFNDIGKYDEAKRVFEQANQSVTNKQTGGDPGIDRKFAVKHLEIADLYFRYRRYDEAIEEYSKAGQLDPTILDIRIKRAKAYAKKGFLTRSMQELQQLKLEHPHFVAGSNPIRPPALQPRQRARRRARMGERHSD